MFKFIEKKEVDKNVSNNYINKVERELNIKFPKILREFYLKYNFSQQKKCTFKIKGIEDHFILDTIIPLKYGTISLEKEYKWVLEDEYISNEYIPLAVDMDGDNYYWNSKNGNVYYISHENVENPILICKTVEDFFNILNNSFEKEITIPNYKVSKKNQKKNTIIKNKKIKDAIVYIGLILLVIFIIWAVIKYN